MKNTESTSRTNGGGSTRNLKSTITLILFLALLLSGCSSYIGSKDFRDQAAVIQQKLTTEDWNAVDTQLDQLLTVYNKNEWKIQLLGDEGEYERLHESINRLRAAIEMKDLQSASLELATLKTIVEDIYTL